MRSSLLALLVLSASCTPSVDLGRNPVCRASELLSCNSDPNVQAPLGMCFSAPDGGAATCACGTGAELDPAGRCRLVFSCSPMRDCGPGGTCNPDGRCTCARTSELADAGRCQALVPEGTPQPCHPEPPAMVDPCREDLGPSSAPWGTCRRDLTCDCLAGQVKNPATGRCVPANGVCLHPSADAGEARVRWPDGGTAPSFGTCDNIRCGLGTTCGVDCRPWDVTAVSCVTPAAPCGLITCSARQDCADPASSRCVTRTDAGQPLFDVISLAPSTALSQALAMAVTGDRVGVAYFDPAPLSRQRVTYVEWSRTGGATATQPVQTVDRTVGLSVAFQPSAEPAVAYLGGGSDSHPYWLQSDAVVSKRAGGTTWVEQTVATNGSQVTCGNVVSDTPNSIVVGLWPQVAFNGAQMISAYRDLHGGQFPQQDFAGSDVEVVDEANGRQCAKAGGDDKGAWGGRIAMVLAGGAPALAYDKVFGGGDTRGQDVLFQRRTGATTWSLPQQVFAVADTASGATLGFDPQFGYAAAVYDASTNQLWFSAMAPTASTWEMPALAADGSGGNLNGLYPSLAMGPDHQPQIAYSQCGQVAAQWNSPATCPAGADELRIAYLAAVGMVGRTFFHLTVDTDGAWLPKLGFLSNGKRVVAYQDPRTFAVKLAVER